MNSESHEKNIRSTGTVNSIVVTKKKQIRNFMITIAAFACLLGFLYYVVSDSEKKSNGQKAEKTEFVSAIQHVNAGTVLIERVETRLAKAEKTTEVLQRSVEELTQAKQKQAQEAPKEQEKINVLINRIDELEKKLTLPASGTGAVLSGAPGQPGGVEAALMIQGIRDDAIILAANSDVLTIPAKNPKDYVPSGTFVKAVTLGGADASAATNAQSNPQPMLFRVIEDGTMPNSQKSHLQGCLVTAAVVGDISSERGFIRLETLSCIEPDTNRIIDLNVEGTVFDPEGKGGMRGIPLWREGALLQRAFAAGALSGLASGVSQKFTKTSISPLGAVQTTSSDIKDIMGQGVAGGLGNAMEKLADYNIRRAEQYHPVLQLTAGTLVDLVFLKGFYLSDTKNDASRIIGTTNNVATNGAVTNNAGNNLSNMPRLTITPEQAVKLSARTAELNG